MPRPEPWLLNNLKNLACLKKRSPTSIKLDTANAPMSQSSPVCPNSGFSATRVRKSLVRSYPPQPSAFFRNDGLKSTTTGWKICRTGASAANCGGGTEFLFGTESKRSAVRSNPLGKDGSKTRMFSILGLALGYGPLRPWVGPSKRQN